MDATNKGSHGNLHEVQEVIGLKRKTWVRFFVLQKNLDYFYIEDPILAAISQINLIDPSPGPSPGAPSHAGPLLSPKEPL